LSKENSGSTGPIYIMFSPYDKYLVVNCRYTPFLRWLKGRCHGNQLKDQIWQNRTIHLYS